MTDQFIYLTILGTAVLVMAVRRLMAHKPQEVTMEDFQVSHPVDAFDMPERDEPRWRRSYSG